MTTLITQLQEKLSKMSEKEFLNMWEELKDFNEIGPIAIDYIEEIHCKINTNNFTCNSNTTLIKNNEEYELDGNSSLFLAA